jgi:antitoxin component of RelBE/YafQ-DinJ toxin-antitoxin module
MTAKLTLRLDNTVIKKAKNTAQRRGVSLSRMVEDYFKSVARQQENPLAQSPVLSEIAGVLSGRNDVGKLIAEYKKHLTEKYR